MPNQCRHSEFRNTAWQILRLTMDSSLLSDVQNETHFADALYAVRSVDSNKVCLACLVEEINLSTKYLLRSSLGRVITTCAAFDSVFFLRSRIKSFWLSASDGKSSISCIYSKILDQDMKKEQIEKASYCPTYRETTILITVTVAPNSHLISTKDKRHLLSC